MNAVLALEDGTWYRGLAAGASGEARGEVVFNTSMTGYQEVLTDPSYAGQIVTMTYPQIGNYGVTPEDAESSAVQVAGFVVREASRRYSNWRARGSLQQYLHDARIVALDGVDTRALTRHLRSAGAMRAAIAPASLPQDELMARVQAHPRMEGLDLTCGVSTEQPYDVAPVGPARFRILAYDFGVKRHSLRLLAEHGCAITTLPASTPAGEILDRDVDGLFISNGPGDPDAVSHALAAIRGLADRGVPVFGICLGHQLVARAFGGSPFQLLYG